MVLENLFARQKYVYLSKYTHACIPSSMETTAQGKTHIPFISLPLQSQDLVKSNGVMAGNQTYMSVEILGGEASQRLFVTDARQDLNIILPPPY